MTRPRVSLVAVQVIAGMLTPDDPLVLWRQSI